MASTPAVAAGGPRRLARRLWSTTGPKMRHWTRRRYLWSYTIALRIAKSVRKAAILAVIRREDLGVERLEEAQRAYEFVTAEYDVVMAQFEPL